MKFDRNQFKYISILILALYASYQGIQLIFDGNQNLYLLKIAFIVIVVHQISQLPITNIISQLTGVVMGITIPVSFRNFLFGVFCDFYNVNRKDMIHPLHYYKSFRDFFTRKVKPRTIMQGLVSPCDSKILSISKVTKDECLLVKGVHYKLGHFLTGVKGNQFDFGNINTGLHQIIFYLAPGDYHRYHCPVDFTAKSRLHIPGKLCPVKESNLKKGLYEGNERVILEGLWEQGLMYIVFVGATNVGSMSINFDKNLLTNNGVEDGKSRRYLSYVDLKTEVQYPYIKTQEGVHIRKGEEIGKFNMGSTVVLIFEGSSIDFKCKSRQTVRYGESVAIFS